MYWLSRGKGFLLIGALLSLAACASGARGSGTEGNTVLRVENDLVPATSLSIYLVPRTGGRRFLGSVGTRETGVLRFNPVGAGEHRFVAETLSGAELVSQPIFFDEGATLTWSLTSNIITASGG